MNVRAGSESDLLAKAAIAPVTVAIDGLRRSFMFYSGGYYYEPTCSTTNLNHAVLVVGWGTDATHGDYWLAKNQWGSCTVAYPTLPYSTPHPTRFSPVAFMCPAPISCIAMPAAWGDAGYVYMARNRNNNCGVASLAVLPCLGSTCPTTPNAVEGGDSSPVAPSALPAAASVTPAAPNTSPSSNLPVAPSPASASPTNPARSPASAPTGNCFCQCTCASGKPPCFCPCPCPRP